MFGRPERGDARPLVLAHRGGAALGAENSIEVLAAAASFGADAVEIDIQELGDGSLILAHDGVVRRRLIRGRVRLRSIDRSRYERLTRRPAVTVADLVDRVGRMTTGPDTARPSLSLYLDVKSVSPAGVERLIETVAQGPLRDHTVVGSFSAKIVKLVAADGRLPASILYGDRQADPLQLQTELGCAFVHPCFDSAPSMVDELAGVWMERAHRAGLTVVSWNTNDARLIARMVDAGFDLICTDDPRIASAVLRNTSG